MQISHQIPNEITPSLFSYSTLSSFGRINQVCTRWNTINNQPAVIASVFQRCYSKFTYNKKNENFIKFVLKNLNAFTFEKQEFEKMFGCVCDSYSPIVIDSNLTKPLPAKLADYLPEDKGNVTTLPQSLYFLMSSNSRIKLTKEEKITLLLKYAEKNPGIIAYHINKFKLQKSDLLKLSKLCVAKDRRTLLYISYISGLDTSSLKQIQEENNIKDKDLNQIKAEALELYVKDGEPPMKSDGKPFILGQR